MAEDEPKIFIDEGWKAQVQREKEEALKHTAVPGEDAEEQPDETEAQAPDEVGFDTVVEALATPAAFALGLIPSPETEKVMVNLAEAKFLIDMLLVLRAKTKDNLTPEEDGFMTQTIAGLQRAYVLRAQQVQEAELNQAGINLRKPGSK